jgi:hypothetical protein
MLFKHSGAVVQSGWSSPAVWSTFVAAGTIFGIICSPIIGAVADQTRSFVAHVPNCDLTELPQTPQVGPFSSADLSWHIEHCVHHFHFVQPVSHPEAHTDAIILHLVLRYSCHAS